MFRQSIRFIRIQTAVEVILLMGVLSLLISTSSPTQAATPAALKPAGPGAANAQYACSGVLDVEVFTNRVLVHCSAALPAPGSPVINGINWFGVPTTDSASASRFLGVFQTALLSGKTLVLYLDPADTSGAAWGCDVSDCRTLGGATVGP